MTIHAAKGLEFPVVFVVDLDNAGRTATNSGLAYWKHPTLGPIVNIPPESGENTYLFLHQKQEEKRLQEEELQRLLYVASTRAISQLYYTATLAKRRKPVGSLFSLLEKTLGLDTTHHRVDRPFSEMMDITVIDTPPPQERPPAPHRSADPSHQLLRLPLAAVPPSPYRYLTATYLNSRAKSDPQSMPAKQALSPPPGDLDPRQLGTFTHQLLEWRLQSPKREIDPHHPQMLRFLRDIPPHDKDTLRQEALALSEKFFASSFWGTYSHYAGESEVDFIWKYQGFSPHYYITGRIDLLIETEEALVIVDFKTDKSVLADAYALQMGIYQLAISQLQPKPVKGILYFLREARALSPDIHHMDETLSALLADITKEREDASAGEFRHK